MIPQMQFEIIRGREEETGFCPDLEGFYCVKGQADMKALGRKYTMKAESILFINPGQDHALSASSDAILCHVRYSQELLSAVLGGRNVFCRCNSCVEDGRSYEALRAIFRDLIIEYIHSGAEDESRQKGTGDGGAGHIPDRAGDTAAMPGRNLCLERSLLYRLLDELTENFMFPLTEDVRFGFREGVLPGEESCRTDPEAAGSGKRVRDGDLTTDELRLQRILQAVSSGYRESISLTSLADEMYMSVSALSRFFRRKMGINFAEYLTQVRLQQARQALLDTDDNVTRIAMESGFSNLSVFNRAFRDKYGMAPAEYRKRRRAKVQAEREQHFIEEKSLRRELEALDASFAGKAGGHAGKGMPRAPEAMLRRTSDALRIDADAAAGSTYRRIWQQTVNVGAVSSLLLANTQYHVTYLAENLGFRYVRLWSVFSSAMHLTDGVHIGNYSFDKIDVVFDFLYQYNLIPYLELGATRPDTAVRGEQDTVYYEEEETLFRSRQAWEEMIRAFLRHVLARYGKVYVGAWIFELGCDASHRRDCYADEREGFDYFRAYAFLYSTVKQMLPEARVGGPAGILNYEPALLEEFLRQAVQGHCVPDFISVMLFPYRIRQRDGVQERIRIGESSYEVGELDRLHRLMDREGISAEIYVSEWNDTLSSRNYLNDSCYRGTDLINKMTAMIGKADMANIWMASDWVSSYYDVRGVANGGNGLLTKDTICKPAYFALQFLNSLGSRMIARQRNGIVTQTQDGHFYILCTNHKELGSRYYLEKENFTEPGHLRELFEDNEPLDVEITLRNVPEDRYVVKRRAISPEEGSLLHEWERFDFENELTGQEVKYIRQSCYPRHRMRRIQSRDGVLVIRDRLIAHEMALFHVYRMPKPI